LATSILTPSVNGCGSLGARASDYYPDFSSISQFTYKPLLRNFQLMIVPGEDNSGKVCPVIVENENLKIFFV
jgi:hypothetical protein